MGIWINAGNLAEINRLYKDEKGQGMAEYGLIIALVAIAVIGGLTYMGSRLYKKFTDISDAMGD